MYRLPGLEESNGEHALFVENSDITWFRQSVALLAETDFKAQHTVSRVERLGIYGPSWVCHIFSALTRGPERSHNNFDSLPCYDFLYHT